MHVPGACWRGQAWSPCGCQSWWAKRRYGLLQQTQLVYCLLQVLIANAGRVLTHRQLLREVWGPSHTEQSHYLRIYMGHLRHKLEADPAQPAHLLTETGVGYRLWVDGCS